MGKSVKSERKFVLGQDIQLFTFLKWYLLLCREKRIKKYYKTQKTQKLI